eukprot:6083789-Amphidinium_carterae.1
MMQPVGTELCRALSPSGVAVNHSSITSACCWQKCSSTTSSTTCLFVVTPRLVVTSHDKSHSDLCHGKD